MTNKIWEDNLREAKLNYQLAGKKLELAELELKESEKRTGIEKWLGFTFESSSGLTEEFSLFNKEIKKYIKENLDSTLELVNWNRMHFEFSGFIRNKKTKKIVYFSCSDIRYFNDAWYDDLLIRTAENEKDYTGGSNNSCKIAELSKKAKELTD